jgi:hypothetical protein
MLLVSLVGLYEIASLMTKFRYINFVKRMNILSPRLRYDNRSLKFLSSSVPQLIIVALTT